MNSTRTVLSFILVTAAFAQTSPVPYDPSGPTFTNKQVRSSYAGFYSSIRKVNFLNFAFHTVDDDFRLKNGRYRLDEPFSHYAVTLESTHYLGRSARSNVGSALVLLSWEGVGGSSSQGGIAQVFTLSDGHLKVTQDMGWDTHFDAGQPTESFSPSTNTLVIRTAHYIPGDAHCCVSAMDVVTLKWDGTRFVQTSFQTELSAYGKREGKVLPKLAISDVN